MTKIRGIYVHIPFCTGKCAYCDFYSVKANEAVRDKYVEALTTEIISARDLVSFAPADTLYIGGGTPSTLSPGQIERIVAAVSLNYRFEPREVTMECNPDPGLDVKAIKNVGINRLSMGVQSLSDIVLAKAGRRHTAREALEALEKARKYFDNLSADIMIGLPGESTSDVIDTLRLVAPLVDHISVYMLTLEKGTKLYKSVSEKTVTLPDDDSVADRYDMAVELLGKFGFSRYEISNFARPGRFSKHNMKYWQREEYLGFGASAHGFADGKRYSNPASVSRYVSGENFGSGKVVPGPVSVSDAMAETVMLALRTSEGLDVKKFEREFGVDFADHYSEAIAKTSRMTEFTPEKLVVRPEFMLFESAVAREFMG